MIQFEGNIVSSFSIIEILIDSLFTIFLHFLGCWYHMHSCLTPSNPSRSYLNAVKRHREKAEFRDAYTEAHGLQVVKIYECEWRKVGHLI